MKFHAQRLFSLMKVLALVGVFLSVASCSSGSGSGSKTIYPETFTLTKDVLKDKIMGGWAGQVIGCTFGGPTEFRYKGTMIQEYVP